MSNEMKEWLEDRCLEAVLDLPNCARIISHIRADDGYNVTFEDYMKIWHVVHVSNYDWDIRYLTY